MHILRGSGLQGMRGMLPHRRIPGRLFDPSFVGALEKISWRILNVTGSRVPSGSDQSAGPIPA